MVENKAATIIDAEISCVKRNISGCDRDCGKCDLVQKDDELLDALYTAKRALAITEHLKKIGYLLKV